MATSSEERALAMIAEEVYGVPIDDLREQEARIGKILLGVGYLDFGASSDGMDTEYRLSEKAQKALERK